MSDSDKPVLGPSGFGPEIEKANQGLYAAFDRAAEARRKAQEPPTHVASGISEQADWMAHEAKKPNAVVHLGDVINRMETEHNQAEKAKRNENLELRRREGYNRARMTDSAAPGARIENYEPQPFDREAAKAQLLNNYPWLDINHPDNPVQQELRQQAEHTKRQYDRLLNGGTSAEYFLSSGVTKGW